MNVEPAIEVRPLNEGDLAEADRVFRVAFGTFLGMPDPAHFAGDADVIATRWRSEPAVALGAFLGDELAGSIFVANWGSVRVLGPLTIRPDLWDRGIGKRLMRSALATVDAEGANLVGLFTFADSPKHVGLYERFGFSTQAPAALFSRPVTVAATPVGWSALSESADTAAALAACADVSNEAYDGLNLSREIRAVAAQHLGDTVVIGDGQRVTGFAICHVGPGSEGGTGVCYIKVGVVRPGADAGQTFARLLDACNECAARHGASLVIGGANTARRESYAALLGAGFEVQMLGIVMTRPAEAGYNRGGVYLIDDWR